jgi:hypothetical protein
MVKQLMHHTKVYQLNVNAFSILVKLCCILLRTKLKISGRFFFKGTLKVCQIIIHFYYTVYCIYCTTEEEILVMFSIPQCMAVSQLTRSDSRMVYQLQAPLNNNNKGQEEPKPFLNQAYLYCLPA